MAKSKNEVFDIIIKQNAHIIDIYHALYQEELEKYHNEQNDTHDKQQKKKNKPYIPNLIADRVYHTLSTSKDPYAMINRILQKLKLLRKIDNVNFVHDFSDKNTSNQRLNAITDSISNNKAIESSDPCIQDCIKPMFIKKKRKTLSDFLKKIGIYIKMVRFLNLAGYQKKTLASNVFIYIVVGHIAASEKIRKAAEIAKKQKIKEMMATEHHDNLIKLSKKEYEVFTKLQEMEQTYGEKNGSLIKQVNNQLQQSNVDQIRYLSNKALLQISQLFDSTLDEIRETLVTKHNERLTELQNHQNRVTELKAKHTILKNQALEPVLQAISQKNYQTLAVPQSNNNIDLKDKSYLSASSLKQHQSQLAVLLKKDQETIIAKHKENKKTLIQEINDYKKEKIKELIKTSSPLKSNNPITQVKTNAIADISSMVLTIESQALKGSYLSTQIKQNKFEAVKKEIDDMIDQYDIAVQKEREHNENIIQINNSADETINRIDTLAKTFALNENKMPFSDHKNAIDEKKKRLIAITFTVSLPDNLVTSSVKNNHFNEATTYFEEQYTNSATHVATYHNQQREALIQFIRKTRETTLQSLQTHYGLEDDSQLKQKLDLLANQYEKANQNNVAFITPLSQATLENEKQQINSEIENTHNHIIKQHQTRQSKLINEINHYKKDEIARLENDLTDNTHPISQAKTLFIQHVNNMILTIRQSAHQLEGSYLSNEDALDIKNRMTTKIDSLIHSHKEQTHKDNAKTINQSVKNAKRQLNELRNSLNLQPDDEATHYINQQISAISTKAITDPVQNTPYIDNTKKDETLNIINQHVSNTRQGIIDLHNNHRNVLIHKIDSSYQKALDNFKLKDNLKGNDSVLEKVINGEKAKEDYSPTAYLSSTKLQISLDKLENAFKETGLAVKKQKNATSNPPNAHMSKTAKELSSIADKIKDNQDISYASSKDQFFKVKIENIVAYLHKKSTQLNQIANSKNAKCRFLKQHYTKQTHDNVVSHYQNLYQALVDLAIYKICFKKAEDDHQPLISKANHDRKTYVANSIKTHTDKANDQKRELEKYINTMHSDDGTIRHIFYRSYAPSAKSTLETHMTEKQWKDIIHNKGSFSFKEKKITHNKSVILKVTLTDKQEENIHYLIRKKAISRKTAGDGNQFIPIFKAPEYRVEMIDMTEKSWQQFKQRGYLKKHNVNSAITLLRVNITDRYSRHSHSEYLIRESEITNNSRHNDIFININQSQKFEKILKTKLTLSSSSIPTNGYIPEDDLDYLEAQHQQRMQRKYGISNYDTYSEIDRKLALGHNNKLNRRNHTEKSRYYNNNRSSYHEDPSSNLSDNDDFKQTAMLLAKLRRHVFQQNLSNNLDQSAAFSSYEPQ